MLNIQNYPDTTETQNDQIMKHSQHKHQIHKHLQNILNYQNIPPFNTQTNTNSAFIVMSVQWMFCLSIVLAYTKVISPQNTYFQMHLEYAMPIIQTMLIINKIIMMIHVYHFPKNKEKKNPFSSDRQIDGNHHLRLLFELDLNISGIQLVLNPIFLAPNYIISILLQLLSIIFLQNYTNRKDLFYRSNANHFIINKGFFVAGYTLLAIVSQLGSILVFQIGTGMLFGVWIGWFLIFNSTMGHSSILICQQLLMSMIGVLTLTLIFKPHIYQQQNIASAFITVFLISIIIAISIIIHHRDNKWIALFDNFKHNIKTIDLQLLKLLDSWSNSISNESHIYGICIKHRYQCKLPNCQLKNEQTYNASLGRTINMRQIDKYKQQSIKQLIKCLYGQVLSQNKVEQMLDYCQYLINEVGNIFTIAILAQRISSFSLGAIQRMRMFRITERLLDLNHKLNNYIYQGLELQTVIATTQHFQNISGQIQGLVNSNLQIWNNLNQNYIDLTKIIKELTNNINTQKEIQHLWKSIVPYFGIQTVWKVVYINYQLFITNQILYKQVINDIEQQQQLDKLQSQKHSYLHQDANQSQFYNKQLLFNNQSCLFVANYQYNQLSISNVGTSFTKITGYTPQSIIGTKLDKLLPASLRFKHQESFNKWVNQGRCCNQKQYHYRLTEVVDCHDSLIPVVKYFKLYVNCQGMLEFPCLLKVNTHPVQNRQKIIIQYKSKTLKLQQSSNQEESYLEEFQPKSQLSANSRLPLQNESNIFLKDQTLTPPMQIIDIQHLKYIIRIFFLILIISSIVLYLTTVTDSKNLIQYSVQYITFMQSYRVPMILGNNYFKTILKIGNQTKAAAQIQTLTTLFSSISVNQLTKKTLFDPAINVKHIFTSNSTNQSYDQIQLYYLMMSTISSLNFLPINRTGYEFTTFNSFLTPNYDNLINDTKNKFHESFQTIINKLKTKQLWILGGQMCMLLVFLLLCIYKLNKFYVKMQFVLQNIAKMNPHTINFVRQYWKQIKNVFNKLLISKPLAKTQKKIMIRRKSNLKQLIKHQQNYINTHQNKVYTEDTQSQQCKIKFTTLITASIILLTTLVLSTQLIVLQKYNQLILFENDGFSFLKFFPTATIVGYGCLEKYYSLTYPNQTTFNPLRYSDVLASMQMVGNFEYIGDVKDVNSQYYSKQRNYFFGNPCTYNAELLSRVVGITSQKCSQIIGGAFTRGLTSYMRAGRKMAQNYITGKTNLSASNLDQFSLSVSVLSAYILDAISTWGTQFAFNTDSISTFHLQLTLTLCICSIFIYLLLFQYYFLGTLARQYLKYRQIMIQMIPSSVFINDKIIRQSFIQAQILS